MLLCIHYEYLVDWTAHFELAYGLYFGPDYLPDFQYVLFTERDECLVVLQVLDVDDVVTVHLEATVNAVNLEYIDNKHAAL